MKETFGSVVRERMRQRGVTVQALADAIGRSQSQTSLLVRDLVASPTPEVMAAVATHLGLDEERLVRLLGYLSTVPKENGAAPFAEGDPRAELVELLGAVPDGRLPALREVLEAFAGR